MTDTRKVQLGATVDTTSAKAGFSEIKESAKDMAAAVGQAGAQAGKGLDGLGASGTEASVRVDRATSNIVSSIQRATAAAQAGAKGTPDFFANLAKVRGADLPTLQPYLDQLARAQVLQQGATNSLGKFQASAAQTAAALRRVPAQFTDIVTSLQGGQSPLTVLFQQGGQLRDMFGSAGGAAKALGSYVLGLVNPYTVAAAAALGLAAAYEKGASEGEAFRRTVILSGGAAGVTADQLATMASAVKQIGAGTQGRAAEVLNEMAQTGAIGAENMQRFAAAALQLEHAGGPAAEDTLKVFQQLAQAPLQASLKLNETTGFLTRSVYEQIKALEQQGRTFEAGRVAQDAFYQVAAERGPALMQNLGSLERGWLRVKDAVKGAGDAILSIGRADTLNDQIKAIQTQLAEFDRRRAVISTGRVGQTERLKFANDTVGETALREQLRILMASRDQDAALAASKAKQVQLSKDQAAWDQAGLQFLTKREQMEREIVQAQSQGTAAGASPDEIAARVGAIRKKYDAGALDVIPQAAIAAAKRQLGELTAAYSNAEEILAAQRQAGLISEADYYDAKRAFIRLDQEAQVRALQAENAGLASEAKNVDLTTEQRAAKSDQIRDNLAKIDEVNAKAASSAVVLGIQQASAADAVTKAYQEARQAADEYLTTLQKQHELELGALGAGTVARSDLQAQAQIRDRYESDRQRIQNDRANLQVQQGGSITSDQKKKFDDDLRLNAEFKAKALAEWQDYHDVRMALEADWSTGASEAIANYSESTRNVAKQSEDLFSDAFKGMEDALVDFVHTGKLNFTSLANTIIDQLLRVQIRQAIVSASTSEWGSAIIQGLGYLIGGGSPMSAANESAVWNYGSTITSGGGRAGGGSVDAGGMYEVVEQGPELLKVNGRSFLMMGSQPGNVVPNSQLASAQMAAGPNITFNIGAGVQRSELVALVPELRKQIKAEVMGSLTRPGSTFTRG